MKPNFSNPLRDLERQADGLAKQITTQVRQYFEKEFQDLQQQITFLQQVQTNRLKAQGTAIETAAKRVAKGIDKFL